MSIDEIRERYSQAGLSETALNPDPILQFEQWLQEAAAAGVFEPGAACLASASRQGEPSARMVLLKGVDSRGFIFFTNYESPKAQDLAENPQACPGGGLGGAGPPGPHLRKRRANLQGAIGPLLRDPAGRQPAQRLGLSPERGDRQPPGAGRADAALTRPDSATVTITLPPFWGGYLPLSHPDRILAGPPRPPERPASLPPPGGSPVGRGETCALSHSGRLEV